MNGTFFFPLDCLHFICCSSSWLRLQKGSWLYGLPLAKARSLKASVCLSVWLLLVSENKHWKAYFLSDWPSCCVFPACWGTKWLISFYTVQYLKHMWRGHKGFHIKQRQKNICFTLNEEIISLRTKSSSQPVLINCLIGNTHNSPMRIIRVLLAGIRVRKEKLF